MLGIFEFIGHDGIANATTNKKRSRGNVLRTEVLLTNKMWIRKILRGTYNRQ